jgi:hypothetical protein
MDVAMEDNKGWQQQRWHLMAVAAGGNGRQQCLTMAMDNGEGRDSEAFDGRGSRQCLAAAMDNRGGSGGDR